ncbi:MAG: ArsA family ATPase [Bacteroidota bacterium]
MLDKPDLFFVGGKGGVGKTTLAATWAIHLAKKYKTLLVSTDPAHSLADSLAIQADDKITAHPEIPNLHFWQINANHLLDDFKKQHHEQLALLIDTSSYLDEQDTEQLLELSIPGIDEVMSLKSIIDIYEEKQFEKYVIDTAPTGHTLRLLSFPELLDAWVKVMAKLRWKYRIVQKTFTGKYKADDADDLLLSLKRFTHRAQNYLKDAQKTAFWVVSRPQMMVIEESTRLIQQLQDAQISVQHLLINQVMQESEGKFCQELRAHQKKSIELLETRFSGIPQTQIPMFPYEIRGIQHLKELSKAIFNS